MIVGKKILTRTGDELTILDKVMVGEIIYTNYVSGSEREGILSITKYLCEDDEQRICLIEPSEIEAIISHKH